MVVQPVIINDNLTMFIISIKVIFFKEPRAVKNYSEKNVWLWRRNWIKRRLCKTNDKLKIIYCSIRINQRKIKPTALMQNWTSMQNQQLAFKFFTVLGNVSMN